MKKTIQLLTIAFTLAVHTAHALPFVTLQIDDSDTVEPYTYEVSPGVTATYNDPAQFVIQHTSTNAALTVYFSLTGAARELCPGAVYAPNTCPSHDYTLEIVPFGTEPSPILSCGSVYFPLGSSKAIVKVIPASDTACENTETVTVTLIEASTYDIINAHDGNILLRNSPVVYPYTEAKKPFADEGGTLTFKIVRDCDAPIGEYYETPQPVVSSTVNYYAFIRKIGTGTFVPFTSGSVSLSIGSVDVNIAAPTDSDTDNHEVLFTLEQYPNFACYNPSGFIYDTNRACGGGVVAPAGFLTNGHFSFKIYGETNTTYSVSVSTNLTTWNTSSAVTGVDYVATFTDTNAPSFDNRYYVVKNNGCCVSAPFGFSKITAVESGFTSIANQYDRWGGNAVTNVFANVPNDTYLYKFTTGGGAFDMYLFFNGTCYDFSTEEVANSVTFGPGDGAFLYNSQSTPIELVFMGEIRQGNLQNTVPAGETMRSAMIPQAGLISQLGLSVPNGSTAQLYNPSTSNWDIHTFTNGTWDIEPFIDVGQSVFFIAPTSGTWNRTFSVCD